MGAIVILEIRTDGTNIIVEEHEIYRVGTHKQVG